MKQLLLSILFIATALTGFSQDNLKLPALSPTAKITQEFSTSNIEISYSRPAMRKRRIFGDVVPFGNVWRTGANAATKIKIGEELEIGGKTIKAGEYALYSIPEDDEWEIILNKGVGNWGASGYDKADDVARFYVKVRMTDKMVQNFTIDITNITFNTCNIELSWERTRVVIPVRAHNEDRLLTSIDKAINTPNIPYYQSASYYFETNQRLDKAYEYVNKGIENNPKAFYMYLLKAKLAQRMGKRNEAIDAAKKAIEYSKGTANEKEYKHNAQKIINALSK
jgi:tetratricopeptide (TPR) repeat protein